MTRTEAIEWADKYVGTFSTNDRGYTTLPAETRITLVLRVADWILIQDANKRGADWT